MNLGEHKRSAYRNYKEYLAVKKTKNDIVLSEKGEI